MINFTENLYKTQWLDLVFNNRNKAYGAYALRQQNAHTTVRAFVAANALFISIILSPYLYQKITGKTADLSPVDEVISEIINLESRVYKIKTPVIPALQTKTETAKLKTIKYSQMVVAPADEITAEPPTQSEIAASVISSVNSEGKPTVGINQAESSVETGILAGKTEDTGVYEITSIEVYPEFPGGHAAFAKYLSRNLRYPGMAIDNNVQGRILVSFVIEKNGDLSNIQILRGIGSGCDEEAMRVLKKSPRWNPGVQNKQNVRVAYTIPINFQLP